MRPIAWACVLAALSCAPAPEPVRQPAFTPAPAEAARPNILLVTLDTVRADHTSAYGYDRVTTPFLSELAAEGVRFDRAYATSSWTVPTIASLLTSLPPARHGVTRGFVHRGLAVDQQILADEHLLLPEALREAGYRTFGVTANGHLEERNGFAQGFDRYVNVGFKTGKWLNYRLHKLTGELARSEPWFLWVHYFDPHGPYTARKATRSFLADEPSFEPDLYLQLQKKVRERDDALALGIESGDRVHRYLTALYDGEIHYVDDQIRSLVRDLDLGRDDMIVVTADHGEEFLDHGDWWHGHTLYEEAVRVPLIVRLPGHARAGKVVAHPVSLTEVMPTILQEAGLAPEPASRGLFAPPQPVRASLALFGNLEMILDDRYKYVHDMEGGERWLFDLAEDPHERVNLSDELPNVATDLGERLRTSMFAQNSFATAGTELTEEQAAELRSLGYLD